jgi:hypothetical protein
MYDLSAEDLQFLQDIGPKYTSTIILDKIKLTNYIMSYSKKIINEFLENKFTLETVHPDYYHFINGIKTLCPSFIEQEKEIYNQLEYIISKYPKCKLC